MQAPRTQFNLVPELTLEQIAAYHDDVVSSLRLYFSASSPTFTVRFAGKLFPDVTRELDSRLVESDTRSSLAVLTGLEAYFFTDFELRCRRRSRDDLSVYFREIERTRTSRVRLDEDILEGWKIYTDASEILVGQLRGAFKFRHWLAHRRYWSPKLGRKYDFDSVYIMASAVVSGFSLTV